MIAARVLEANRVKLVQSRQYVCHYAEMMWASILSDIDIESSRALDDVLSPQIIKMVESPQKVDGVCGMAGMLNIHKDA